MHREDHPLLEDLLKLAGNFFESQRAMASDRPASRVLRGLAQRLDLVKRDEFDAAFAMLAKIRTTQDALAKRLSALENQTKPKRTPAKAPTKAKQKKR